MAVYCWISNSKLISSGYFDRQRQYFRLSIFFHWVLLNAVDDINELPVMVTSLPDSSGKSNLSSSDTINAVAYGECL